MSGHGGLAEPARRCAPAMNRRRIRESEKPIRILKRPDKPPFLEWERDRLKCGRRERPIKRTSAKQCFEKDFRDG